MSSRGDSEGAEGRQIPVPRPEYAAGASSRNSDPHTHLNVGIDGPLNDLNGTVLVCGPAIEALGLLPDGCAQTVVTSPPSWSLQDHEAGGQIGCDDALESYERGIVMAFDQVRRLLADDGTVWVNVVDSHTPGNHKYRAQDRKNRASATFVHPPALAELKPKNLIGVPWRLAFALQSAGWWLRSEVIWHKPNARPESLTDLPTTSHETVFLLSKSQNYYYDTAAVKGPNGRRLRTMWDINTEPHNKSDSGTDDHPSVMPKTLARRCIQITSRTGDIVLDPYAGSGTTLIAAQELGRNWAGIELNPAYVDLIQRRVALGAG